jgi:pre-mRNA-processing factor 39
VQVTDEEVKAAWLEQQNKVFEATLQTVERRRTYEVHLKRRWWSSLPVDPSQLLTWWLYLDAVEAEGDATTTYGLFERCLVPCASYPGVHIVQCVSHCCRL